MPNTSVTLGPHWEAFIAAKLAEGRYASASEMMRAGLRLLEAEEQKLDRLRALIREGEESGIDEAFDFDAFRAEMMEKYGAPRG